MIKLISVIMEVKILAKRNVRSSLS